MRFVHLSQEEERLEMYIREAVETECGKCCRDVFIMVSTLVDFAALAQLASSEGILLMSVKQQSFGSL